MKAEEDRCSSLTAPSPLGPLHRHPRRHHGGVSKGCGSLAKIIAVISSIPPPRPPSNLETKPLGGGVRSVGRGLGIDLNLRLGPPQEIRRRSAEEEGGSVAYSVVVEAPSPAESGDASVVEKGSEKVGAAEQCSISPAESAAGDALTAEKSSVGECDPLEVRPSREEEEDEEEAVKEDEEEEAREEEVKNRESGSEGYLGLLLEAVRQVSGEFFDEKKEEEQAPGAEPSAKAADASGRMVERGEAAGAGSKRRSTCWTPPFGFYEDTGPVVRSKRGRSQALPSRYRDTVLEPWAKLPTVHRQGSRRDRAPAGKSTGKGSGHGTRR